MKKTIALFLVFVLALGLFGCGGNSQAVDTPAGIADVTNGDTTVQVKTVEEVVAAIDPSGNTVIKLLKDVSCDTPIQLPYSCTIDLGGHTLTNGTEEKYGIVVGATGSENTLTTLKNGTLNTKTGSIRVTAGSLCIDSMTIHSQQGNCVTLCNTTDNGQASRITNSTLASAEQSCFIWTQSGAEDGNATLFVESTALVAYAPEGSTVFSKYTNVKGGMIELGQGVTVFGYGETAADDEMLFNGSAMAEATTELTLNGQTLSGITKWSEDVDDQVLDVLMIGNSFCYYFTEELRSIANAAGIQLNLNNVYKAGCYVQEHWDWLEADASNYKEFWITNDFGRFNHPDNLSLKNALAYDDWDVITLQQHFASGVTDVEDALAKCTPYVDNLYGYLKDACPDARFFWQTTWAYQVGHEKMPSTAEQTLRQNNIITVSQTLADRNGVNVIPSGQAWAIARANPVVGDNMCRSDLYHDGDVGGGQYLNACVWFEVLTGKSCIGNTWRPSDYALAEEKVVELQKAAHQAVAEMYGDDYAK